MNKGMFTMMRLLRSGTPSGCDLINVAFPVVSADSDHRLLSLQPFGLTPERKFQPRSCRGLQHSIQEFCASINSVKELTVGSSQGRAKAGNYSEFAGLTLIPTLSQKERDAKL
jgi:hypothetical protein